MSLNPRAIATLGIGFGAELTAYLGLWPLAELQVPDGVVAIQRPDRQVLAALDARRLDDDRTVSDISAAPDARDVTAAADPREASRAAHDRTLH